MAAGLKWNGSKFSSHLQHITADGLVRAGAFYHGKCRQEVSRPNTGVRKHYKDQSKQGKDKRKKAGRNRVSYTVYPNPSKPGEAPRLRTGFGQRNVVVNHNRKKMYTRVGVTRNGMYMFYLEIGTRHILRRPWLVKTLMDNKNTIGKLAASGK